MEQKHPIQFGKPILCFKNTNCVILWPCIAESINYLVYHLVSIFTSIFKLQFVDRFFQFLISACSRSSLCKRYSGVQTGVSNKYAKFSSCAQVETTDEEIIADLSILQVAGHTELLGLFMSLHLNSTRKEQNLLKDCINVVIAFPNGINQGRVLHVFCKLL